MRSRPRSEWNRRVHIRAQGGGPYHARRARNRTGEALAYGNARAACLPVNRGSVREAPPAEASYVVMDAGLLRVGSTLHLHS